MLTDALLPPVSITGVEPLNGASLGWYRGTARCDPGDDLARYSARITERVRAVSPGVALRFPGNRAYGDGLWSADGSWLVAWDGRGDAAGTVMVDLRQSYFERHGSTALTLAHALTADGVRASRIDVAGDVLTPATRPRRFFEARAAAITRAHRDRMQCTEWGDGRQAVTVGSRSSERYLRIYDKPERACVRHELEIKGARAAALAVSIGVVPLAALWATEYAALVRWVL